MRNGEKQKQIWYGGYGFTAASSKICMNAW